MPEPKKTRRTYESQTGAGLDRLRLVNQRSASAEVDTSPRQPDKDQPALEITSPEPAMVKKLIKFIKTI